jgi:hypothetical protein
MEDASVVRSMCAQNDVGFRFDLKSAYHHIDIFAGHRQYLGFYWQNNYYVFNVLPFGISTAAYIFTKVLRNLVQKWRPQGIRIILYLDDGLVLSKNKNLAKQLAITIQNDISEFGFLIAEEKSDWIAKSVVQWLGLEFDFEKDIIKVTEERKN